MSVLCRINFIPIIMAHVRKRVLYSGHVQGVGFRYNALRCAKTRSVTGFVRNLPDGRVELITEGHKPEVEALLEDIASSMSENIDDISSTTEEPTGEFADFSIRS